MEDKIEQDGELKTIRTPRLDPVEKLYVRAYLSTLSHKEAHKIVCPSITTHITNNMYAKRDNVQFHISLGLQEKAEALLITPELILEKLLKEATREGAGSNHAARIQALTQLGKYLGIFEEKKESMTPTFNIINYSSNPIPSLEKIEDNKLEGLSNNLEESIDLPDNIQITSYKETDDY